MDITITTRTEGLFTFYTMTPIPTRHGYLRATDAHLAVSTYHVTANMVYVSFAYYEYNLPKMPGAWYDDQKLADEAIARWAEMIHLIDQYANYVEGLEGDGRFHATIKRSEGNES